MIADESLRWAMAVLLLAATLYAAFRATRQSPPAIRVGFGLHAAMMTAMALMLAPGFQWPVLPQILVFGLAAWWFVLRAVSRRSVPFAGRPVTVAGPGRGRSAGGASRGSLLYNALTMAAMAYMLAAVDFRGTHGMLAGPEAGGFADLAAHHDGAAVTLSLPGPVQASVPDWSSQPAPVLAVVFGVAGAVWGVLLLWRLRPHNRKGSGDAFLELVAAASMAVMFAALAA